MGKLYNLLAMEAARAIVEAVPQVRGTTVYLLSQIGHPLDEPLVATAQVTPREGGLTPSIQAAVAEVLDAQLANIDSLRERILRMEIPVF